MAQKVNLESKVSADDSDFQRAMRAVSTSADRMSKRVGASLLKVGAAMKRIASASLNVAKRIARIGITLGTLSFAALTVGIKKSLELGGALSDLGSQTGIAVGKLVVMQRAFQDAGVSGDKVGTTVNKMQKAISDLGLGLSTQVDAFSRLGIEFADIIDLDPAAQFELLQRKISGLQNPTERASTAMMIFGRSGGELQALFSNGGAFDNAEKSVGAVGELLERRADTFDRAADLIGGASAKLSQFFAGVTDKVVDVILPLLEQFDALDLTGLGQQFGDKLNTGLQAAIAKGKEMIELFKSGELGHVIRRNAQDGLHAGVDMFFEAMSDADNWKKVGKAAGKALVSVGDLLRGKENSFGKAQKIDRPSPFGVGGSAAGGGQVSAASKRIAAEIAGSKSTRMSGNYGAFASTVPAPAKRRESSFRSVTFGKAIQGMLGNTEGLGQAALGSFRQNIGNAGAMSFGGLDRLASMQTSLASSGPNAFKKRAATVKVGSGGRGVGLQGAMGGLGAVRRNAAEVESAARKRSDSLVGTNDKLNEQLDLMEETNELLTQALTVS